jgi:hypothetical protein
MSLSRGQLSSSVLENKILVRSVAAEIRQGRTKCQVLAIFQERLRPRIERIFDEMAFVCPKCFMPFLRQSDLTSHARGHS